MGHPGSNKVREFACQDIQATIVRGATPGARGSIFLSRGASG